MTMVKDIRTEMRDGAADAADPDVSERPGLRPRAALFGAFRPVSGCWRSPAATAPRSGNCFAYWSSWP
jgi:hypothetical protein